MIADKEKKNLEKKEEERTEVMSKQGKNEYLILKAQVLYHLKRFDQCIAFLEANQKYGTPLCQADR